MIADTGLENYVSRFPNELNTEISQNTVGGSGEQAQMIALLRALLSNKKLLVLDEPISNIDTESRTYC